MRTNGQNIFPWQQGCTDTLFKNSLVLVYKSGQEKLNAFREQTVQAGKEDKEKTGEIEETL